MSTDARNWFDAGGQAYARFRPEYPLALAKFLATISPGRQLAVDVGCGNGQLTAQLRPYFGAVIGIDPSADQIANAAPQEGIRYLCAPAEQLPVADHTASLIAAAQAAHWFDLPRFYDEVRRIARDQAVIALISYGVLELEHPLQERFGRFYWNEIGSYWPPERKLVDTAYAGIDFPFEQRSAPAMHIRKDWNLDELLGYISTWSAVRHVKEAAGETLLTSFAAELGELWGEPQLKRPVQWPINMRVGIA